MYNSINILSSMLVNNTKTGNQIIDYIFNILILSSITYLFKNIVYIKKYILIFFTYFNFNKANVEIIIDAQSIVYDRNGVKANRILYSKIFKSIIYYIKELKSDEIFSKREPDNSEKDKNQIFDILIPDQDEPFSLTKDIKCTIKLNQYEINNKDNTEFKKNHIIKIFSENKNIKIYDLEVFIENCLVKYNK